MGKINQKIKSDPKLFNELISDKKLINNDKIELDYKINNNYWLIGSSEVIHEKLIDKELNIIIEQSKRESKYGIKLRCEKFTNEPFFRFDSDGPSHRNNFPHIPLEEQTITTPHFNTFDNNGKPYAYKNETLKKENEVKEIVQDINFGLSLFCMETNSMLSNGNFPLVYEKICELDFEDINLINYDNINFE